MQALLLETKAAAQNARRSGGVKIGPCHLGTEFDVAQFMHSRMDAAYVSRPCEQCRGTGTVNSQTCEECANGKQTDVDAIIVDCTDFGNNHRHGMVRDKIVIVDLKEKAIDAGIAMSDTSKDNQKFPCEMAILAQRHGALGMIFVYSGDELRGTMLPLSQMGSCWIPVIAITLHSANGVLVREKGQLRFDPNATGVEEVKPPRRFGMFESHDMMTSGDIETGDHEDNMIGELLNSHPHFYYTFLPRVLQNCCRERHRRGFAGGFAD